VTKLENKDSRFAKKNLSSRVIKKNRFFLAIIAGYELYSC